MTSLYPQQWSLLSPGDGMFPAWTRIQGQARLALVLIRNDKPRSATSSPPEPAIDSPCLRAAATEHRLRAAVIGSPPPCRRPKAASLAKFETWRRRSALSWRLLTTRAPITAKWTMLCSKNCSVLTMKRAVAPAALNRPRHKQNRGDHGGKPPLLAMAMRMKRKNRNRSLSYTWSKQRQNLASSSC